MSHAIQVGQTTLTVSQMGLGTAPLANLYGEIPEAQAIATIQYALAQGINFFDTAPLYGAGLAERRLARALVGIPRDQYVIATKIGRLVQPDGSIQFDYSPDGVMRSLEASLKRLEMDYVDILHIHEPETQDAQALLEAFPTLADLRRQGIIKAVGAGMNRWQTVVDVVRQSDFDCFLLAGRYTLLEQDSLEFLSLCQEKRISLFLAGVFNSGVLATGPSPEAKYNYRNAPTEVLEKATAIQKICQIHDTPLPAAALQFARSHPAVSALVVGAASVGEIQANLNALDRSIPSDLWGALKQAALLAEGVPVPTAS